MLLFHYHAVFGGLPLMRHGELAVDFFFMLSGFVLSAGVDREAPGLQGSARFMLARIGRLWPIMALGILAGLFVAWMNAELPSQWPLALLLALLFIPYRQDRAPIFPLDGPQWSLMLELIANVAHVLVLRRLSTPALLLIAALSWLSLAALAQAKGAITFGPMNPGWQLGVLRIGYAYTLGCIIARHHHRIAWRLPWWTPALLLTALLIGPARDVGPAGWFDALTLLAFAGVLVSALNAHPPAAWHRALTLAGAASWPLYAFHMPAFELARWIAAQEFAPLTWAAPATVLVVLGVSIAVAASPLAKGITFARNTGRQAPKRLYVAARLS